MRLSSVFTFVAGLAVAGGSAYMALEFLETKYAKSASSQDSALVEVIVASQDIAFGQAIESHMLSTIAWPREAVPVGSFTDYGVLLPQSGDPSRRARRAISKGELVLDTKV